MVAHDRRIANLFVASADGRVLCSADQRQSARVDDRPDFQRALAATQLVIGTVTQSRGTGRPVVPFLLARRAAAGGTVEAVAVATVEVEAVLTEVKPLLDPGARIVYVDEDGLILLRWPDPGDWTGRNIAASDVFRAMQALGGEGSTLLGREVAAHEVTLTRGKQIGHLRATAVACHQIGVGAPRMEGAPAREVDQ